MIFRALQKLFKKFSRQEIFKSKNFELNTGNNPNIYFCIYRFVLYVVLYIFFVSCFILIVN